MSKIFALCSKPKVDWLTDGKRYEVLSEWNGKFKAICDAGDNNHFHWYGDTTVATWTRIEESEPPQWALDKAAKASGYDDWEDVQSEDNIWFSSSVKAHASTLAKYEKEPVDPVLVKAREMLCSAEEFFDNAEAAHNYISGMSDITPEIRAVKAALRLPAMGSGQ